MRINYLSFHASIFFIRIAFFHGWISTILALFVDTSCQKKKKAPPKIIILKVLTMLIKGAINKQTHSLSLILFIIVDINSG